MKDRNHAEFIAEVIGEKEFKLALAWCKTRPDIKHPYAFISSCCTDADKDRPWNRKQGKAQSVRHVPQMSDEDREDMRAAIKRKEIVIDMDAIREKQDQQKKGAA